MLSDDEILTTLCELENEKAHDQLPLVWHSASGSKIFDKDGNSWIDLTSSIFVTNCGHCHPKMVEALSQGVHKLSHAYTYPTEERAIYLRKLIDSSPKELEMAVLLSTGTEASERALKIAVKYSRERHASKSLVLGIDGNFHGKTFGALLAGGFHDQKAWIAQANDMFKHIAFPYPWVLEKESISGSEFFAAQINELEEKGIASEQFCCLFLESFQGWGAIFYPSDFVQAAREWCTKHHVLLIFDECQGGFGRTGKMFAYEHYGVTADIVTCGKGISGSLPLSAVLGRAEVIKADANYTSTHGGHPLSCIAGTATLDIIEEEGLIEEALRKEALIKQWYEEIKAEFPSIIGPAFIVGMIAGIFIYKPDTQELDIDRCELIIKKCFDNGVFHINTGRGTLKIGPPLNIPDGLLNEALANTTEAIRATS